MSEKKEVPSKANIGIQNLGNTCWLNSALKFLATDEIYDFIFAQTDDEIAEHVNAHSSGLSSKPAEIQQQIELRNNFKLIIEELRQPTGEVLNELYMQNFIELLKNYNADFLLLLTNLFEYTAVNPSSVPNLTTIYSHDFLERSPRTDPFVMPLAVSADPSIYVGDKIDLNKCMNNPTEELRNLTSDDDDRGDFTLQTRLTNGPDKLCMQIGRLAYGEKCDNAVLINDHFEVTISSYQTNAAGRFENEQEHRYLVTGAIILHGIGQGGALHLFGKTGRPVFFSR